VSISEISQALTALAAVGALGVSLWNQRAIHDVHVATNSMKDELVAVTRSDAKQEGIAIGRAQAS